MSISFYTGKRELLMVEYEALETLDPNKDYNILDYPTTTITNEQMQFALTCKRLFPIGTSFICDDNGMYVKGLTYMIIDNNGSKEWKNITGREVITMTAYEALDSIEINRDYEILDYPNTSITNEQMIFALTCKRLFPIGSTFVCSDQGVYNKGSIYKIIEVNGSKAWEKIDSSSYDDSELRSLINNKVDKEDLNINLVENINYNSDADSGTLTVLYNNIYSGVNTSNSIDLQLASDNKVGLMSTSDYIQIRNNTSRIEQLEGQTTRLLYDEKTNPTSEEINTFVISKGFISPFEGIAVVVDETYHIWHYYENDNIGWKDDGLDTVNQFTNDQLGVIKGSESDGKIYAETDGTGSVYGWTDLKNKVTTNEINIVNVTNSVSTLSENIINLQNNKVDKVTGKNLSTNDFSDDYKSQVSLNTTNRHSHTNKTILDNITASYTDEEKTKLSDISVNATKVESSTINGNIKINNVETAVYTLPEDVVQDSNYVHTDNNYTTTEKDKLANIQTGAQVNTVNSVNDKTGDVKLSATDVEALPLSGGTLTGDLILTGSTEYNDTTDNMSFINHTHPKITFENEEHSQQVALIYTDENSYRSPAGLKLVGPQGGEWFETPNLYTGSIYGTNTVLESNSKEPMCITRHSGTSAELRFGIGGTGTNRGIYDAGKYNGWIFLVNDTSISVGSNAAKLNFYGSTNRPAYKGSDLALKSDTTKVIIRRIT